MTDPTEKNWHAELSDLDAAYLTAFAGLRAYARALERDDDARAENVPTDLAIFEEALENIRRCAASGD